MDKKPLSQRIGEMIKVSEAAKIKGCTPNAIRNAISRQELSEIPATDLTPTCVIINTAFINWRVAEWGGRLHKKDENGSDNAHE